MCGEEIAFDGIGSWCEISSRGTLIDNVRWLVEFRTPAEEDALWR